MLQKSKPHTARVTRLSVETFCNRQIYLATPHIDGGLLSFESAFPLTYYTVLSTIYLYIVGPCTIKYGYLF